MDCQKMSTLQILCQNKKILDFEYNTTTTLKNLKDFISELYLLSLEEIKLSYDNKFLLDSSENKKSLCLSKIMLTNLNKIGGEKVRVRIILVIIIIHQIPLHLNLSQF